MIEQAAVSANDGLHRSYRKLADQRGRQRDQIGRVLETLSDREQIVIKLRFGLDDGTPRSLEEIGRILGVTRERVRQVEEKALKKLRANSTPKLKEYYHR